MTIRLFRHYLNLSLVVLAIAETALLVLAPLIVEWLRVGHSVQAMVLEWRSLTPKILAFVLSCGFALAAMGLYSPRQRSRTAGVVLRAAVAHLLAVVSVAVASFFVAELRPDPLQLLLWGLLSFALISVARMLGDRLLDNDAFKRRVVVYGSGLRAQSLLQLRRRSDQRGFQVVGYMSAPGEPVCVEPGRLLPGDARQLLEIAKKLDVDEIVVAMDDRRREFPVRELLECRLAGVEVIDLVSFLERETGRVRIDVLNPSWMIFGAGFRQDLLRQFTKRVFDLVAAILLLAVTWPLMLLAAVAITLEDGLRAPVFYRQPRVGLDCRIFNVLKFRSMRVDAERDGQVRWATSSDTRITAVGRIIRKVRIDELPQIFNVLRGDMSLVGPRPERPEFVTQLGQTIPYYDERHCAKPGVTGWAQLCYPYGASERDAVEKLQYDLYYVKNHTLLFDLMILLQTVEVVLFGKGSR